MAQRGQQDRKKQKGTNKNIRHGHNAGQEIEDRRNRRTKRRGGIRFDDNLYVSDNI
ncbi:Transposable element Tc1 transposase, partial [Araneus ventricosus]